MRTQKTNGNKRMQGFMLGFFFPVKIAITPCLWNLVFFVKGIYLASSRQTFPAFAPCAFAQRKASADTHITYPAYKRKITTAVTAATTSATLKLGGNVARSQKNIIRPPRGAKQCAAFPGYKHRHSSEHHLQHSLRMARAIFSAKSRLPRAVQ